MTLEDVKLALAVFWSWNEVKVIIGHVVINVIVAIAAAVKQDELDLRKIGNFLYRKLVPYVGGYAVVRLFGEAAGLTYLLPPLWLAIETTLTGDLLDSLAKLGLRLPDQLARRISADSEK